MSLLIKQVCFSKIKHKWAVLVLLTGLGLRLFRFDLPLLTRAADRELLTADITKALYVDKLDIFHLRRSTDPLKIPYNLEFPAYNFLVAVGYFISGGVYEPWGRLVSIGASLVSAIYLFKLTLTYFSRKVGVMTLVFFYILSPLGIWMSRSFQPDSLMLMGGVLAIYYLRQWQLRRKTYFLYLSAGWFLLATLTKLPIFFLAIPLGSIFWKEYGQFWWKRLPVWMYGLIVLLPVLLWYKYSIVTGKGLQDFRGGSSWDSFQWSQYLILANPRYWINSFYHFIEWAVTPFGLPVFILGLSMSVRAKQLQIFKLWIGAGVFSYLLVPSITFTQFYYYYSVLPAVAVLAALGLSRFMPLPKLTGLIILITAAIFSFRTVFVSQFRVSPLYQNIPVLIKRLGEIVPRDNLIITHGGPMLYYSQRQGFGLDSFPDAAINNGGEKVILELERYKSLGARYAIIHRLDLLERMPVLTSYLKQYPLLTLPEETFQIYQL